MEKQTLEIKNLTKTFINKYGSKLIVLEDISLKLCETDQFTTILAPLGAGKTTLLKSIAGLVSHDGEVYFNDRIISEPNGDLIYIPSKNNSLPWLNVRENIQLPYKLRKSEHEKSTSKYDQIIELVGLGGYDKYYPYSVPSGFNIRIALGRALAFEPKFILLDDIFTNLEGETRLELVNSLRKISAYNSVQFILATTNISEATLLSQKIILMNKNPGKIIKEIEIPSLQTEANSEIITKVKNEIEIELKSQNMLNSVLISL